MTWDCTQLEGRLTDYLDSRLAPAEMTAADAHARGCARCAEWFDARRAALWLQKVEKLETPPGLETRILALTTAPRPKPSLWAVPAVNWRQALTLRFGLGLSSAVLSLLLVLNFFGISLSEVRLADLHPVNLYRSANRQAYQSYAWGVRFVNDLRVVYEIRSRLEEMQEPADTPAAAPERAPQSPPPAGQTPQQKKQTDQNLRRQNPSTQGVRQPRTQPLLSGSPRVSDPDNAWVRGQYWLLATQLPGGWGAKR
ncbi:MAG: zf-HC2 domain-containing protein [Candidatus Acidiferrales bacterium]